MIEVLVSALVVVIVAGAVLSLITATTRSAAQERLRATAYAAAQEDQARLRTMRLSSLSRLNPPQKTLVTLDGTEYTVESTGVFVNNSTGTDSSCTSEGSAADYVRIASKVTWQGSREPVVLRSIVSPSNGSLDPNHGTLLITATNSLGEPLSGVGISATGAGTFSGSTDSTGCANFSDLPAGNYTMTTSATGFVNADAQFSPWTTTVGAVAGSSTPVSVMYGLPGRVKATFKYRVGSSSEYRQASADSVVVYNALMTKGAESFGSPGGTRSTTVEAYPLFPFKEADTVYAGYCEANKAEGAARTTVIVPSNGMIETPEIQLPALNLNVTKSGSPASGARVTITDQNCKVGSTNVKRVYSTNSSGNPINPTTLIPEAGLPWGTYEVCASSGGRHKTETNISVKNLTSGTNLSIAIPTSGSGTSGECP